MIRDLVRRLKHRRRQSRALAEIAARPDTPGRAHGLPTPLIVSLTSYAARFSTLMPTLQAILHQTVEPDRVILWLDEGDVAKLPAAIRDLARLDVRTCPEWRSYKKIVPTLLAFPDAHIVTADDDVYYPADWLADLVDALHAGARIACLRAHRIALSGPDRPAPYARWARNIDSPQSGPDVFLTGVSGVLYAPGVFHPDVTRDDLFTRLSPSADDVWLYWMHRMAGVSAHKIGPRARILEWTGSQTITLRAANTVQHGNDNAVAAMLEHYGWPG